MTLSQKIRQLQRTICVADEARRRELHEDEDFDSWEDEFTFLENQ
jgi:hypothetical protein